MELLTKGADKILAYFNYFNIVQKIVILAVLLSAGSGGSNVKNSSSVVQLRKLLEDVSFDSIVVVVM
jgi:hypothetical protein